MVITIQGGLYGALVYTNTQGEPALAPSLETCNGDLPGSGSGARQAARRAAKQHKPIFREANLPGKDKRAESEPVTASNILADLVGLLLEITSSLLLGETPLPPSKASVASAEPAKVAYVHEKATPMYAGVAAIISGPFQVTSKHGSKIEGASS